MTLLSKIKTSGIGFLTVVMILGTITLPQLAMADITCCIFQNGAPCVSVCYVTDLTCADMNVGFLIVSCTDMVAGGGPNGLENINVLYDGQVNIGNGPFAGTVELATGELTQFFVTRPVSPHETLPQTIQLLGITAGGDVYVTDVPTAGLDGFAGGDLVIQATRGGMEISTPLTGDYSGRMAIGDITLSVCQIDRSDNETVLSSLDTAVDFADQTWAYVGGGAVSTETMSWDALKANFSQTATR